MSVVLINSLGRALSPSPLLAYRNMIRVYRSLVQTPISPKLRRFLYNDAASFFSLSLEERQQRRHDFDSFDFAASEIKDALLRLFHGKCAYCETSLEPIDAHIHRHRPPVDTITEQRDYLPDHYWWLAYHWSNLYLACSACVRAKGSHFPIDGVRSPLNGKAIDLREELPQLLDPCADQPEKHLIFDSDGLIYARTWRGKQTIERLDLNREKLVYARREGLQKRPPDQISDPGYFKLERWRRTEAHQIEFIGYIKGAHDLLRSTQLQAELKRIKEGGLDYNEDQRSLTCLPTEHGLPYVKAIHVQNVGPIDNLSINLSDDRSSKAPWLALIGENNVGKSTILKSIALALAHQKTRSHLRVKPRSISDSETGEIDVERVSDPVASLRWTRPQKFVPRTPARSTLILAYGSTRLTADRGLIRTPIVKWERIGNLFNPYTALNRPERWLLSVEKAQFEYAARTLKTLLNLSPDASFKRSIEAQTVELRSYGRAIRITKLSDGLQSVLALGCDIMASSFELWGAPEIAEGIVLLDEIENHLHPKWKMKIVSALRRAFPRMQFIITTHDPLCLKGMEDGEVVVLRRNIHGIVRAVENLPPISRMRIDQILTSEHFGLSSTLDPHIEELYERYYALLRDMPESVERNEEISKVTRELDQNRLLGNTRRERLMLEAIDRYLSSAPEVQFDAERLSNQLKEKLSVILRSGEQASTRDRT